MEQNYVQRGYLHEDFRLFHLRGAMEESVDWHYHTFHKIIEFLGGESGYGVEGKQYLLQPGDLVLVPQGCIHRPEAEPNAPYERRILYLSPEFLRRAGEYAVSEGKAYLRLDSAEDSAALAKYYESLGFVNVGTCQDGSYKGILREKKLK